MLKGSALLTQLKGKIPSYYSLVPIGTNNPLARLSGRTTLSKTLYLRRLVLLPQYLNQFDYGTTTVRYGVLLLGTHLGKCAVVALGNK